MIKSDHHEGYIVAILMWLKWPKGIKGRSHLIPLIYGAQGVREAQGVDPPWGLDPPVVT
jgi:hypothetical protein